MARRKGLFDRVRNTVQSGVREGMNKVMDKVVDFDERGGVRGAFERGRVRAERRAQQVKEILEDRGVTIEFGRYVPQTPDQRSALAAHYRTLGVEPDSDFEVVKAAYRNKMREHHPDRHAGDPDREREATRVSQEITIAWDAIEAHHRRTGS